MHSVTSELRSLAEKDRVVEVTLQSDIGGRGRGKGKRKLGNKNGPTVVDGSVVPSDSKEELASGKVGMPDSKSKVHADKTNLVSAGRFSETMHSGTSVDNVVLRRHTSPDSATSNGKPLPPILFCALESDQPILDILKPSIIIVYHPDMSFVREIEVYRAENPSKGLKVYFLFYEDSTEVQKFEASIRRENGAFESLIRQKSMMIIPVDQVCTFFFPFSIYLVADWVRCSGLVTFSIARLGVASFQIIDS